MSNNIKDLLSKKLDYLKENTNYKIVNLYLHGSQNYRLDEQSDDYESSYNTIAFVIPTLKTVLENREWTSKVVVHPDGSQTKVKDIRFLARELKKCNIHWYELLFTKHYIVNKDYQRVNTLIFNNEIKQYREDYVNYDIASLLRMMKGEIIAKNKRLQESALDNDFALYGYDAKELHHLVRLSDMANEIMRTKKVEMIDLLDLNFLTKSQKEALKNLKTSPINKDEALRMGQTVSKQAAASIEIFLKENNFEKNETTLEKIDEVINNYVLKCVKKDVVEEIRKNNKRKESK